jgi:hypothetical protein
MWFLCPLHTSVREARNVRLSDAAISDADGPLWAVCASGANGPRSSHSPSARSFPGSGRSPHANENARIVARVIVSAYQPAPSAVLTLASQARHPDMWKRRALANEAAASRHEDAVFLTRASFAASIRATPRAVGTRTAEVRTPTGGSASAGPARPC